MKKEFNLGGKYAKLNTYILTLCLLLCFPGTALFAEVPATETELTATDSLEKSLKEIFDHVEKNSEYVFFYNRNDVDLSRKLSINLKELSVPEILTRLSEDPTLEYRIDQRQVNVRKKAVAPRTIDGPAQRGVVANGVVVDTSGEPLVGVAIAVKGTTTGTSTDIDGMFSLKLPDGNNVLEVTYIGFQMQTIAIQSDAPVRIVLFEDTQLIDEVVVVGYGTQKKISVTGAIVSINSTSLKQTPVANITNALAGKVTGLMAIQTSGEPGYDGADLWIRGMGTYQGSTSPLVLVDGAERSFGNLDPNEIENISILKDASATAVYGVRGANGVIVVTTKRGQVGKPRVSVNLQHGVQTPTRMGEYLNSYDALTLYQEGLINDGKAIGQYTDEYIAKFRDRSNPTYQYLYPDVNWIDELLKKNTGQTQANVNVSGGGDAFRYFISVGYLNQDGIYKYSDQGDYNIQARTQRYNFRSNIDLDITRQVNIELNLGGIIMDSNFPGTSADNIFNAMKRTPSYWYPMTNPDGSVAEVASMNANPYALLTQTGYAANSSATLNATVGVTWKLDFITPGLSAKGRVTFDNYNYRNVSRGKGYKSFRFTIDEDETDLINEGEYLSVNQSDEVLGYSVSANGSKYTVIEGFLNYARTFGRHDVTGLLLYNQHHELRDVAGGTENAIAGMPYRKQGFVGRITYGYDNRYYMEVNAGYNGSENFPKGKRFGLFPSFSASWVASEEAFLNHIDMLSLLKFRLSYGLVGNDQIGGSRFLYQSTWDTTLYGYQFGVSRNGFYMKGAKEAATGNPNVTWEKARKLNVGLDVDLWNRLIHFTGDVFYERRTDILTTPLTISDIAGVESLPMINAGIVTNKGFEVEAEHRKDFRNWGYNVRANFSYARNKIVEMTEPAYQEYEWQAQTGRRVGERYGLIAIGLFENWEDINNSPVQSFGDVQPGDIKYLDINKDGVINSYDEGYLGKIATPDKIFGLSVGFSYKNFDVSVLFQGVAGGTTWFTGGSCWPFESKSSILADVMGNYWSSNNTDEQNRSVFYPRMVSDGSTNNYRESTYWLISNDYLRLKNVEIGYNLPSTVLKYCGLQSARVYVNGSNLLTWDKMKVFDPEAPDKSGGYPQMKIFNVGINVTF